MSGEMARARKVIVGYFAQHQLDELERRTDGAADADRAPAASRRNTGAHAARRFRLLRRRRPTRKIAQLSGGERARLLLAIATLDKPNLLILDEPTNHLDIDAREELLTALNDYEGAVVIISHDRRLIEACADRLLLVADGRVTPFDGDSRTISGWCCSKTAEPERPADARHASAKGRTAARGGGQAPGAETAEGRDGQDASARSRRCTARSRRSMRQLAQPGLFDKDPAKGEALSKKRAEAVRALTAAEARWIEAAERYEAAQSAS